MKKNRWIGNAAVCFLILIVAFLPRAAQAAGKKQGGGKGTITCSERKGTFTISGKGAVTASQIKVRNRGSIKKIVVKKGITSLPKRAFVRFPKVKEVVIAGSVKKIGEGALPCTKTLKKVTLPGTFRLVTENGDEMTRSLEYGKSRIDTVSFHAPLSLQTLAYVSSNHLIVSKKDKKYRSIGGVIYSKNGKSIVRVPAYRKTLTVADGCEEFCLQSVMYANDDFEGDPYLMCKGLSKITLPSSVKIVNESKYFAHSYLHSSVKEITVCSNQLDSKDILSLLACFQLKDKEEFLRQFNYVTIREGMCVNSRDYCLLRYTGTSEDVTVPEDVKRIGRNAFRLTKLKRCVIPDTVLEIQDDSFYGCKDLSEIHLPKTLTAMGTHVFGGCEKLDQVIFPDGITKIPDFTFESCIALKDVALADTVTTIGEKAFENTPVPASLLFQGNIKEIQCHAFSSAGWSELVLPATVEKVDEYAFSMPTLERVTVCGSTARIHAKAFISCWADSKNQTLTFERGVEEWQTGLISQKWETNGKSSQKRRSEIELDWQDITGVDGWQIQVSRDSSFQGKRKTYHVKKGKIHKKLYEDSFAIDYVRIRPFKLVDGKTCFGRWTVDKL